MWRALARHRRGAARRRPGRGRARSGRSVLRRAGPRDARPRRRSTATRDRGRAARAARRGDVGDHRRLPARASPGCATRGSSRSPRCRATRSAPASSWRWPATCGCVADDAQFCMKESALGLVPGPDGNKTAGRERWLRQGTGDLRHRPDGRRRRGRGDRAGDCRRARRRARRDGRRPGRRPDRTARRVRSARPRRCCRRAASRPRRAAAPRAGGQVRRFRELAAWADEPATGRERSTRVAGMHGDGAGVAPPAHRPQRRRARRSTASTVRRVLGFARPHRRTDRGLPGRSPSSTPAWSWSPRCWCSGSSTTASSAATAGWSPARPGDGRGRARRARCSRSLSGWLSSRIGEGLIFDLRTQVFGHVQRQSLAFFTRTQTGALVSRLNNDVIGAQRAFTSTLSSTVSNSISRGRRRHRDARAELAGHPAVPGCCSRSCCSPRAGSAAGWPA